ncbi:hypothetical protein HSBAA_19400 [Vreelandella sulfidaeris]|uniref:Uncharacterized protein n=1 Tax=Vreelandella sulfidaeris TaxID=115553 RepID=A0A455UBN3_9GAMM|nr:hypothetical protein HSBAA_19400 [Halomonas sulfidaeris]
MVIEDALKIGFTRDARLISQFLERVEQQLVPLDYAKWHTVESSPSINMKVKLQRAGHILGSSFVEVALREPHSTHRERVVFSGDLGQLTPPCYLRLNRRLGPMYWCWSLPMATGCMRGAAKGRRFLSVLLSRR